MLMNVLYCPIHGPSDYPLLQEDVDALSLWASTNRLSLNPIKCKYMIISRKRQPPIPPTNLKVNCSGIESPLLGISEYGSSLSCHGPLR